jgi:hypothetical protein
VTPPGDFEASFALGETMLIPKSMTKNSVTIHLTNALEDVLMLFQ